MFQVDKYKLHTEEMDKIRSLLLGLASRLARSEIAQINLKKNWNEDEEVSRLIASHSATPYSKHKLQTKHRDFLLVLITFLPPSPLEIIVYL